MGVLDGKAAIVTGSARGIGRATAELLAEQGASVLINDLDGDVAKDASDQIGGQTAMFAGDLTKDGVPEKLVETAVEAFGKIDIVVNNAGITRDKTFHNMDDATWDFVLDVNLKTAFHTSLAAMPYLREVAKQEMKEKGAPAYNRKIVFTTSVAALVGNAGQANYTAAKGGIIALTKSLARELGPFKINVNAVAPGFIETRLTQAKQEGEDMGIPEAIRSMALMLIALGRYGQPEDVANAHLYLASNEADFISGVVLPVAGGQMGS